jgi:hypothetical protein
MKKTAKTIMAFLAAMTMTAGAMGVTAYAEETEYTYSLEDRSKIKAEPEWEQGINLLSAEMTQYLLENGISAEITNKVVSSYAEGLPKFMYYGAIGYDGSILDQARADHRKFCLEIAQLIAENDPKNEYDIEYRLWQLTIAYIPYNGPKPGPAIEGYAGNRITDNERVLKGDVKYHYNPETGIILLDGNGTLTSNDVFDIIATVSGHDNIVIIGKDVKFEILSHTDEEGNVVNDEFSTALRGITCIDAFNTYIYKDSAAETEYHTMKAVVEKALIESGASNTNDEYHYANFLDDSVDPYDILNGKVDVTKNEQPVTETTTAPETDTVNEAAVKEDTEVKVLAEKPASTMKGDADLNGEVSLTDVVVVSKNNLSDEAYPLANDTAYENADMNNDNKVNGLDTSALIENQLGK